jgi:ArsR family transcriptional regulator, cadmium/lead-responsive transcriptional repressor
MRVWLLFVALVPRVLHPPALRGRLLHGLSDPSRLLILDELRPGEARVSDLVDATRLSQPNVSKHLACLWGCGLVAREKRGREVYYWLIDGVAELLAAADAVLDRAGESVGACELTDETVSRSGW